jgi:enoyl-CoA hydratase
VLNALSFKLSTDMDEALTEAEGDDEVGAVIITGSGKRAFSAGGDIHEQKRDANHLSDEEKAVRGEVGTGYVWHLATCTKPTIGAMNGLAYGGGARLAATVDMRVGCERTSFRFLAVTYGRINATWTLPLIVGWPLAKELLFTGREVEAEEAYRIGLLNHLVPAPQLMEKSLEIGAMIARNRSTSVQGIKHLMVEHVGESLEQMQRQERDYTGGKLKMPPPEEAFKDFLARKPG